MTMILRNLFLLLTMSFFLSACQSTPDDFSNIPGSIGSMTNSGAKGELSKASSEAISTKDRYSIGIGDTVKITTFNQDNLSGEFVVDNSGKIAMPLLGGVLVKDMTQQELVKKLTGLLRDGYLVDPKVSVDVVGYQSFYIVGEVQQPGSYDYVSNLNVIKAIALAGGFTRRAVTDEFTILRTNDGQQRKLQASDETLVLPGDAIRIRERFF